MREDLLNAGCIDDKAWNIWKMSNGRNLKSLIWYEDDYLITMFNSRTEDDENMELTPSNYNEILNIIIERKDNG